MNICILVLVWKYSTVSTATLHLLYCICIFSSVSFPSCLSSLLYTLLLSPHLRARSIDTLAITYGDRCNTCHFPSGRPWCSEIQVWCQDEIQVSTHMCYMCTVMSVTALELQYCNINHSFPSVWLIYIQCTVSKNLTWNCIWFWPSHFHYFISQVNISNRILVLKLHIS